ncbi:DUF349 domain-containing protein [Corynebacterium cystitidis]|uniref:DUF349 domain-containing protein n=1 Tax=Corynebacterium cystitidis DSM 20524 TaxID=1121357 RepID=A0A1H9P7S9_9CORY|nr:DUF349 domain-containing protein [Corynebacterium cystitidis]WJY82608.1 hypothetical protein CCYS_08460 [Corynebacterium cystitidis DSM 20524]SER43633.1 protein of unknown function [Corynebacterium cystitidis DSM 20524]SNV72827.1 Domain of Uncharacterised Function (DUF349) [Corynebacterium cystitidis]
MPTPSTPSPQPSDNSGAPHTPSPAAIAKRGPKPGPRPTPGAAHRPTSSPVPVSAPEPTDPSKFGRIADDGTVYVTQGGTERAIGSWQAGTPEEGLAHYGQRFDDLATEVELLEARLVAHPDDAAAIRESAEQIRSGLSDQAVIGDLDGLEKRLDAVIAHSDEAGEKAKKAKAERRAAAIKRKEELAAEAEDLAENSTEWKVAGDRIRAILEEWKTIRGIDRKTDDQLWKRYSRARDSFNRRRGSHFAELDRTRATAKKKKEELVERAEALQDSTDWNETARAYRDLMSEWKAAGRAPRGDDDKLWAKFRAAQDHFFDARNAVNDERDREFEANAEAKDKLLAEYDSQIDPSQGLEQAKNKLRELQEKWEEIGYVPRGKVREYEDKISAVEKRVSDAEESRWRRTDPEAQARVDQFQSKADDLQAQADKAAADGNEKKATELREQAKQWQEFADVAAKAITE